MANLVTKVDLSAVKNKAELQASLVSWNWDFSLVKVEAPKEFNAVGNCISPHRKLDAETGDLHRTARRLGALFEGVSPDAPALLRAYGTRVSEICTHNSKANDKQKHGIFTEWYGPDAASIWAAATSGNHAIAVHLLACMIAEIYDSHTQAVALWVELVIKRKEQLEIEIQNVYTDPMKREARMMARLQDISRADLNAWDNSARAWIRTANEAKQKQRQRAMLHTEKTGASVNQLADPYASVMLAWKDAMVAMNSLVKGIPTRVVNGAVSLGMSAWHLYPNLNVLSHGPDLVLQNDPLIEKTGILTIDSEVLAEGQEGIRWSLPLSYMRYYGPPVNTEQVMAVDKSRITTNQFRFVILGCAIAQWHDLLKPVTNAINLTTKLLEKLRCYISADILSLPVTSFSIHPLTARWSWIGQLLRAAEDFEMTDGEEREIARKLINHGRRCGKFLCDDNEHPPPYFGLSEPELLLPMLNGSESRIAYLRALAEHRNMSNTNHVICYQRTTHIVEFCSIKRFDAGFGCAIDNKGYIRRSPEKPVPQNVFCRWLTVFTRDEASDCDCLFGVKLLDRRDEINKMGEVCMIAHKIEADQDPDNGKVEFGVETDLESSIIKFAEEMAVRMRLITEKQDISLIGDFLPLEFVAGSRGNAEQEDEVAAIQSPAEFPSIGMKAKKHNVFLPFEFIFDDEHLLLKRLLHWVRMELREQYPNYVSSLRASATAMEIYTNLGADATLKTSTIDKTTLKSARWFINKYDYDVTSWMVLLSRSEAFSCIAMFESGGLNIDPLGLEEVFAMTSGNSIFVSSSMICDPQYEFIDNQIVRVPGNIGESGLSFLVSPPNPVIKTRHDDDWAVINHSPFDGKLEPNFEKTSIHLVKTGYTSEIRSMDDKGYFIEREAMLREINVQVLHGGDWIGDLNIPSALKGESISWVTCEHSESPIPYSHVFAEDEIVTADCWAEVLNDAMDSNYIIVRASGGQNSDEQSNQWLARLAASAISVQQGKETVVLSQGVCWLCVKMHLEEFDLEDKVVLIG
ncbi:uncharacterized protein GGS22DRAFT_196460 [Annulohypoxylon maeteangense]|uniref:uncharacterized protein n=1 Tax=Annulohypoxylon maeteangense TaxID=1927788 RepID=UPI00200864DD|nr:uncharacterized protein GGS22DRAFT_196460 [Annulohypoxylon maeteangense]KAI0881530.1 hypothetical protein GGS22DRAFT_196460 [Annulohypoxylon maeteangense]